MNRPTRIAGAVGRQCALGQLCCTCASPAHVNRAARRIPSACSAKRDSAGVHGQRRPFHVDASGPDLATSWSDEFPPGYRQACKRYLRTACDGETAVRILPVDHVRTLPIYREAREARDGDGTTEENVRAENDGFLGR